MSWLENARSPERAEPVKPKQSKQEEPKQEPPKQGPETATTEPCAVCSGRGRVSFGTDDSECGTCGGTGRA